jgi:hypothetical protein
MRSKRNNMNPQSQSDTIKKIAALVLVAAVALGIGYYAGQYSGQELGRQRQERMLKEIFNGANFANALSGKITAVASDKKSLVIEVGSITGVNLPGDYRNKTVLITGDTKIVLRERKSQEVLSAEIAKYQADVKGAKNSTKFTPPAPYSEKEITVGELKVGDVVDFSFSSGTGGFSPGTAGTAIILNHQFTATAVAVTR